MATQQEQINALAARLTAVDSSITSGEANHEANSDYLDANQDRLDLINSRIIYSINTAPPPSSAVPIGNYTAS